MKSLFRHCCCFFAFVLSISTASAFEHKDSHVKFLEYTPKIVQQKLQQKKPYFLLFSAQWCHWCRVFNEKTLTDEKVYSFLNQHFVNIFIDADIHTGAYQKYQAKGVPFTVFLNPDTSEYYKYSGTLYAEPFLEVIQDVVQNVKQGKSVDGEEIIAFEYSPPSEYERSTLVQFREYYLRGVLDNFDLDEYGIGKKSKKILPESFLYLLKSAKADAKEDAVLWISETLKKAIEKIYDPVEGGFFRYAETRDWHIPHYEKMAGLNAGTVLLLYKIDELQQNPQFEKVAEQCLKYLSSTLFAEETGAFLSFQQADTSYYYLNKNRRKNVDPPLVINKIFIDHLAVTLNYLLDVINYNQQNGLEKKVISSLDFLAEMVFNNNQIFHFYSTSEKQWRGRSGLQDHVLLAKLFSRAAIKFQQERYGRAAAKVLQYSAVNFYDKKRQIYLDPELDLNDYEFLMELNANIAMGILSHDRKNTRQTLNSVEALISYFSGLDELLDERLWDGKNWEFLDRYAVFLSAADQFAVSQTKP
ncbi:MAG: thioredoxin domain-containing protein [SAR324 cluster bacterium]|nr:thioredoxin domain-containing protein [SAR324 cluster bacterium]MBL7035592.1 thioredoxin domain-containing protein [SAR324 cluster bacterium]